jgi:hypothetical protein
MQVIRIKENTIQAKAMIALLKTLPFVEFIAEGKTPNSETHKAISDARSGKVVKCKSTKDMFEKLNS